MSSNKFNKIKKKARIRTLSKREPWFGMLARGNDWKQIEQKPFKF